MRQEAMTLRHQLGTSGLSFSLMRDNFDAIL
jgi:hypothetical protein